MSEIFIFATLTDAEIIRSWINADPDIAWLVKAGQDGCNYKWQAVSELPVLHEQRYALWHTKSGPLNIPSGSPNVPDAHIANPFQGWSQILEDSSAQAPWFGGNLPGPYSLNFRPSGHENDWPIGMSQFYWAADHFKLIGKGAHPEATRWWAKLRRFISKSSIQIPLAGLSPTHRLSAYAFPDALVHIRTAIR